MMFQQLSFAQKTASLKNPVDPGFIHINWDSSTQRHIADGGYARMIELKNHNLIAIYAASNGNVEIVRSNDKGNSWSAPIIVSAKANGIRMDAPDILLLNDGALLACYNPRPSSKSIDTSKHFAIRVAKSYDDGLTWKDDELLYTASYLFRDGCWEPSAIQLPSGEIELFFSNENIYRESNEQNISMFRSFDNGKTWTAKPEIVSYRKNSRDGMPVPVYLPASKELLFSIEDNGFNNFKPYIIHSSLKNNWSKTVDGKSSQRTYAFKRQPRKRCLCRARLTCVCFRITIQFCLISQHNSGKEKMMLAMQKWLLLLVMQKVKILPMQHCLLKFQIMQQLYGTVYVY